MRNFRISNPTDFRGKGATERGDCKLKIVQSGYRGSLLIDAMFQPQKTNAPELLAPAGDAACLQAAMESGADAVYFGLQGGFNARGRAKNFPIEELPAVMASLHRRGMKGYVTLNTLVFPAELAAFEDAARAVAAAGVDAVMVQDIGAARILRAVCEDLPIFASTQMSLSSAEGIAAAAPLGIRRVVLARELSIDQIRNIRQQTDVELEVFVHGALCISYSGQCLASLALGGRSANRGQCAQACRMPYALLADGQPAGPHERKYPLSPKDIAALSLLPDLIEAGVDSLKIEGRLKSAEYVAAVTRCYRRAIDAAMAGRRAEHAAEELADMEVSFSRGFTTGWLGGLDHGELVPGDHSSKRGILLGKVEAVRGARVAVRLLASAWRGDGVVFAGDRFAGEEQGGRIYEIFHGGRCVAEEVREGVVELAFAHGAIDFRKLAPGQEVFKTDDPRLAGRLKQARGENLGRRMRLDLKVTARVGQPLSVHAHTATGIEAAVASADPLDAATKHPLTLDVLREQFDRLGKTTYVLGAVEADIQGGPMAALSVLGQLRRELIAKLDAAIAQPAGRRIAAGPVVASLRAGRPRANAPDAPPQLAVLCRTEAQLRAALHAESITIIADFPEIERQQAAAEAARNAGKKIFLATPRIQKPGEAPFFARLAECRPDGLLARNLAAMAWFSDRRMTAVADASLNAANDLSAEWLLDRGASRVTLAADLGREAAARLIEQATAARLEAVVHQHLAMMHSEHCLFSAGIGRGTRRGDCRQPCRQCAARLRDRLGVEHTLVADAFCRNTLYSGVAQTAIEQVPALLQLGVRHFRIELPPEDGSIRPTELIRICQDVLLGRLSGLVGRKRLQSLYDGALARSPLAG